MEDTTRSGQLEGWKQILDKIAIVIAELVQTKSGWWRRLGQAGLSSFNRSDSRIRIRKVRP